MSVRLVFGASGSGKSYTLRHEMIRRSLAALDHFACADNVADSGAGVRAGVGSGAAGHEPDARTNLLYVVPDQYTMQTQQDLVTAARESGRGGILNVDVLSFSRLSHRIFEELGEPSRVTLDDTGKSLILRRVAEQLSDQLPVLGKRMGRVGMVSEAKSAISEFMQYDLAVSDVQDLAAYAEHHGQRALAARLTDLATLYAGFLQYEAERFRTKEETNDLLAEQIPQSQWIANSEIVFDGFTGFTPVQYRVIAALIRTAREVTFSLPLGQDGGPDADGILDPDVPIDPQDLFYLTRHTVRSIMRVAKEAGVVCSWVSLADLTRGDLDEDLTSADHKDTTGEDSNHQAADQASMNRTQADDTDSDGDSTPYRFHNRPALARLEQGLFRYDAVAPIPSNGHVQIYQATSPEEEVRELCIRIHRLVREEGIAYRDCSIVCGDLATYEDALRRMAAVYNLPIHIDRLRPIRRNPLTESVRAALEVAGGDYSYDTMFRYLRAGLSTLTTEEIDRLENYCLAHGIKTRKGWETSIDNDPEMERLRQTVLEELAPLHVERGATAGVRTEALYNYLLGVHARERMLTYVEQFDDPEMQPRRQEFEQIYRTVIKLLDQIHVLLGDDEISAKDYLEIIKAGFDELHLGVIPQRVDRIIAGDMERSRMPECKVLFFLGANDGNVPKSSSKGGLISDLDREFLAGSDLELAPTPREQMYLQRLYLYLNLTKACDRLVISYAQTSADGRSIRPSYLVDAIRRMYTDVVIASPEAMTMATAQADRLVGHADTIQYLALGIRQFADGMFESAPDASDVFCTVYGYAAGRDERVRVLTDAAFSRYDGVPIDKATAAALYGKILSGSVTRLETAAQCYLHHFLQYGLRLREREERRFERRDAGTILHDAIQQFSALLAKHDLSWDSFSREEGYALADEALRGVAAGYEHGLAEMDARTAAATERMRRVLRRTIMALQFQVQHGDFVPTLFESDFGGSDALRYDLDHGRGVRLHGRIDRVDLCVRDGKVYVKIIDYKSGRKDLKDEQIQAGLQLQLPLYLGAQMDVQQGSHPGAEIVPAGMLYYRFDDPILTDSKATAAIGSVLAQATAEAAAALMEGLEVEVTNPAAEEAIYRALRPTGRVNKDPAVLALLDKSGVKNSLVIPVNFTEKGLGKDAKVFTTEEFEQMYAGVRETICRISTTVLDGSTRANPIVLDSRNTACTYCPYKEVCGFDKRMPGYELRELPHVDKNQSANEDASDGAAGGASAKGKKSK